MVVVVKIVWAAVVGYIKIGPAIVVVVGPNGLHAKIGAGIIHSRLFRNILERAVSAIVKQKIALPAMAAAGAFHADSAKLAALALRVIGGEFVHVEIEIPGNEQVHVSVAVIIRPRRPHTVAADAHAGFFGYVLEFAVPQIAIENVAAITGDVDVLPAVIVEVHDRDRHAPAFARQPGGFGNVREMEVRGLVESPHHGIAAVLAIVIHVGATDHQDVEFAIVVTINEAHASAGGLDDVALLWSADM